MKPLKTWCYAYWNFAQTTLYFSPLGISASTAETAPPFSSFTWHVNTDIGQSHLIRNDFRLIFQYGRTCLAGTKIVD